MMTILLLVVDHVVLVADEAVVGVQRLLDGFEQLVHRLGVLAGRRVGVADQLPAGVGQLDLVLLQVEGEVLVALHLLGRRWSAQW